ncbi:MAG: HD-GYP domain-containing protein [Planctomycetaceae bacterium]
MLQAASTSRARTQVADLSLAERLFGDDFQLWACDHEWYVVPTAELSDAHGPVLDPALIREALEAGSSTGGIQFADLNERQSLCLLAIPNDSRHMVAVAIVDRSPESLRQLVQRATSAAIVQQRYGQRMHRRLDGADSKLAAWSTRMSRSQEERTWLHALPSRASLSSADQEPEDVAAQILPEMGRLICARTVAFVASHDERTLSTAATRRNRDNRVWQTGSDVVSEDVCVALITEHGENAIDKPVVCNYSSPILRSSTFSGVLSCIVQEVAAESGRVGWILVINKDLQDLASPLVFNDPALDDDARIEQHCGFGLFESSLVSAAASALTAYARNCSLLEANGALAAGAIRSLVNAIDAKDSYTCGHSDRVAEYARRIAATMNQSEEFCEQIYLTGLVHDVGKIGVPDSVLQKPDRLTAEEFEHIKRHPEIGHAILKELASFDYVLPGVLHHHEAVDGSGYPHGLKGDQIPLQARILAVADAYDAMTSDRPYRSGMPTEKAERIIAEGAGRQWDRDCVAAFQRCIEGIRRIAHTGHERIVPRPACRF